MNKEDVLNKLRDFKKEIEDCQSIEEFKKIEERLKRKIKEIYLDDDPFVKRCNVIWRISPSVMREIQNGLW